MGTSTVRCLYCQSENKVDINNKPPCCRHCGMPLSTKDPESLGVRRKRWVVFYGIIVIFCLVMIVYLPR